MHLLLLERLHRLLRTNLNKNERLALANNLASLKRHVSLTKSLKNRRERS